MLLLHGVSFIPGPSMDGPAWKGGARARKEAAPMEMY
jgi:hypothetical protein